MKNQPKQGTDISRARKKTSEIVKILLLSVVWLVFLAVSFYTYYTIPILVFLGWWVAAMIIRLSKNDLHDGSAYDEESDRR